MTPARQGIEEVGIAVPEELTVAGSRCLGDIGQAAPPTRRARRHALRLRSDGYLRRPTSPWRSEGVAWGAWLSRGGQAGSPVLARLGAVPVLFGLVDGVFDDAGGDVAQFDVCGLG